MQPADASDASIITRKIHLWEFWLLVGGRRWTAFDLLARNQENAFLLFVGVIDGVFLLISFSLRSPSDPASCGGEKGGQDIRLQVNSGRVLAGAL